MHIICSERLSKFKEWSIYSRFFDGWIIIMERSRGSLAEWRVSIERNEFHQKFQRALAAASRREREGGRILVFLFDIFEILEGIPSVFFWSTEEEPNSCDIRSEFSQHNICLRCSSHRGCWIRYLHPLLLWNLNWFDYLFFPEEKRFEGREREQIDHSITGHFLLNEPCSYIDPFTRLDLENSVIYFSFCRFV